MEVLTYILMAILLVAAVAIIVLVTLQKSQEDGLSSAIAGGNQTFFGKDGGDRREKTFKKWTIIAGIVFAAAVLIVYIIQPDYTATNAIGEWKDLSSYSGLFH